MTFMPNQNSMSKRSFVTYISYGIEALWLLAAVVVPLIAAPPDKMLGYIDIPKSAALKSIAAIVAVLLLAEWAIRAEKQSGKTRGWLNIRSWLQGHPTRWVLLALSLLLAVYVLGTTFSVSPSISLWGIKPESDGYDLYSVISYAVIFVALLSHLKRPAQLWRLSAALIFTGVFIGLHVILQQYNIDPILGTAVTSQSRSSSTIGNPILAGAILLMTSILTLACCTLLLQKPKSKAAFLGSTGLLTIQIVGIIYTFSRGPWVGLAVGFAVFIVALWIALGIRQAGRAITVLVTAVAISLIVVFAGNMAQASQRQADSSAKATAGESVTTRVFSVYTEVAEGGVSGRMSIWKSALQIVRERPWFSFTSLPNPWVRPLLGYGPDMFRYVFPLRSSAGATAAVPDEAHDVPLQVAVDLGALGVLSLVAIVVAILATGCRELIGRRRSLSPIHLTILAGLLAVLAGKGVEMIVGIPKESDLIMLAMILAMFVSVHQVFASSASTTSTSAQTSSQPQGRKPNIAQRFWPYGRVTLAVLGILAIGTLTWFKAINYARADVIAAFSVARFEAGDPKQGLDLMNEASDLAPDVVDYHMILGQMLATIGDAASRSDLQLSAATASYKEYAAAVAANPLNAEARAGAANAALTLGRLNQPDKLKESTALYEQVTDMLPNFAVSHYAAAFAYLIANDPQPALGHIKIADSLYNPKDNRELAAESQFLEGGAQRQLGNAAAAIQAFEGSLLIDSNSKYAKIVHRHLSQLYASLGNQAKSAIHAAAAQ